MLNKRTLTDCKDVHNTTDTPPLSSCRHAMDRQTSQSVTARTCRREGAPRTHTIKHQDDTDGEPKGKSLRHSQGCTRSNRGELIRFSRTRLFLCAFQTADYNNLTIFSLPGCAKLNSLEWSLEQSLSSKSGQASCPEYKTITQPSEIDKLNFSLFVFPQTL